MLERRLRTWNGSLVFGLLAALAVSMSTGNSIMDIINTEKVERLLAERRENNSREMEQERRLFMQNAVDGEDPFPNEDDEGNFEDDTTELDHPPVSPRLLSEITGLSKQLLQRNRHRSGDRPNHVFRGQGHFRSNFTGIPDVTTILADLTGVKNHKSVQLITKKEYLKKDWCKTEPIVQKIREDGCLSRTILNRFCYGQCNSFYIPKNPPKRRRNRKRIGFDDEFDESQIFKSCGFCKPKKMSWIIVTLKCPSMSPQYRKKRVQRIKQCKCLAETFNT